MSSSSVPAAVNALHDLLDQLTWPDRQPQVHLGLPRDVGRELVMLGEVSGDQDYVHLGARKRDERFTVDLYVMVSWPGDSPLQAMDRAWQLFAAVESALRDPDHIAPAAEAGVLWSEIKSPVGRPSIEDDGYGHVIESAVQFTARI